MSHSRAIPQGLHPRRKRSRFDPAPVMMDPVIRGEGPLERRGIRGSAT